ncbi:MAG: F-type H+-transporting ATPase subunit delta [Bacillota bacterium]|nr:MAG: F-type H+-transporting ATPase subunit delta [Bacillota bacterium]MBS3950142.1 ATP synthase F1 subunit delta [Peptococcaceae bacterium]
MAARELLSARYAQALFALSRDQRLVDKVQADLDEFANLLETTELPKLFLHPNVQRDVKKALVDKVGVGFSALTLDFFKLLIDKRREAAAKGIIRLYKGLASAERGEVYASVVSARKLASKEATELSARLGGGNKKVLIDERVETSLLGGMIVRVGNKIYDGSVAGRLSRLKHHLTQAQVRITEVKDIAP